MKYTIIPEKDISPEMDAAVREVLVQCFPHNAEHFSRQRRWRSPIEWSVVALDETSGAVCGGIAAIERVMSIAGEKLKVAGVGNVCMLPEYRGTGAIDSAMECFIDEAKAHGCDVGLLFCKQALEKVYARMGWRRLSCSVAVQDENGRNVEMPEDDLIMGMTFNGGEFPSGDIDLMGGTW